MSTTNHTPEVSPTPWVLINDGIYDIIDADGRGVGDFRSGLGMPTAPGNAARAVTCVNALQGISDPAAVLEEVREVLAWCAIVSERARHLLNKLNGKG